MDKLRIGSWNWVVVCLKLPFLTNIVTHCLQINCNIGYPLNQDKFQWWVQSLSEILHIWVVKLNNIFSVIDCGGVYCHFRLYRILIKTWHCNLPYCSTNKVLKGLGIVLKSRTPHPNTFYGKYVLFVNFIIYLNKSIHYTIHRDSRVGIDLKVWAWIQSYHTVLITKNVVNGCV